MSTCQVLTIHGVLFTVSLLSLNLVVTPMRSNLLMPATKVKTFSALCQ